MHLQIYDLDGTICHPSDHRPHSVKTAAHSFMVMDPRAIAADVPRPKMVELIRNNRLFAGNQTKIWILTGRPEKSRQLTEGWLIVHGVPYDKMFMVGDDKQTPTYLKKKDLLEQELAPLWRSDIETIKEFNSVTLVDDDPLMADVCRDLAIEFVDAKEVF